MSRKAAQRIVSQQILKDRPRIPDFIRGLGTMLEEWPAAEEIYKGQFTADDGSIGIVCYDEIMLQRMSVITELQIDGTFKALKK